MRPRPPHHTRRALEWLWSAVTCTATQSHAVLLGCNLTRPDPSPCDRCAQARELPA
eukprot:COSAG01_NODE_65469_length_273_cov_0.597701_1_plen_55_part_10